jgi:hypothetical protein
MLRHRFHQVRLVLGLGTIVVKQRTAFAAELRRIVTGQENGFGVRAVLQGIEALA